MNSKNSRFERSAELRKRAEKIAGEKASRLPESLEAKWPEEARQMLHELRVHQIELEMQNEELRQAHLEMDVARARYLDLYDLAPVGYATLNEKGLILAANLTAATLINVARSEMIKQPFSYFIHPEDQDIYYRHRKQLFENGEPLVCELRMSKNGGAFFWAHLTATAARDENGATVCHVLMSNVTERKQTEERIEAQTKTLESIFNSVPNILLIVNPEVRVEKINHKGVAFSGRKEAEVLGLLGGEVFNCLNAFDGKRCGRNSICAHCPVRRVVESTFQTGESHHEEEGQMRFLIDGKNTELDILISTTLVTMGGTDKVLLSVTDITKLKQTEREKIAYEARLLKAQKLESIGTLAGGIAHDFNNILFPIIGLSEMLMEDLPAGSIKHDNAAEINRAGRRAKDLVKQILSFSRQAKHEKMSVFIQHILKEAIQLTRATIPSNIEITQYLQSDCAPVMADPTHLHQVAMNLITNAYHAVEKAGGTISVRIEEMELSDHELTGILLKAGKYAVLSISDNGCGIAPEIRGRIFEPYFTTKALGKGTGLGLSVVYGIVKDHGGDIRVVSWVGEGTTFYVYLPVLKNDEKSEVSDMTIPNESGTERILLVDDEVPIARIERIMLTKLGYNVTTFTSSLEALAALKATPENFDLVITDMAMPNLTGVQLAKEVQSFAPEIPVIMCTGYSDKIDEKTAKGLGIKGFLMKPAAKSDMAKMVRTVLDEVRRSATG